MNLRAPLDGFTRISSGFGVPRGTRADGTPILHNGTDWPAPEGTPLHAMSDGVVSFRLRPPDDSGNAIGVNAPDGRTTWSFSHMSRVDVVPGDRVRRGQVIGAVGWTGHVIPAGPQGAHVHVRCSVDGRTVDCARQLGSSTFKKLLFGAAAVGAAVALHAAGEDCNGVCPRCGAESTSSPSTSPSSTMDAMAFKLAMVGGTRRSGGELERAGRNGPRGAGVLRTKWSAITRPFRAGGTRRLSQLVDAIEAERDRINRERLALLAGTFSGLGFLGFGELQTRADSMLALLDRIDNFVGVVLPRMEANGDDAAAEGAAQRILVAVGGVSPISDTIDDTTELVSNLGSDAGTATRGLAVAAGVIATILGLRELRGLLHDVSGGA